MHAYLCTGNCGGGGLLSTGCFGYTSDVARTCAITPTHMWWGLCECLRKCLCECGFVGVAASAWPETVASVQGKLNRLNGRMLFGIYDFKLVCIYCNTLHTDLGMARVVTRFSPLGPCPCPCPRPCLPTEGGIGNATWST